MQAVGEFDENDANVLNHGKHHLAKAFCLRLGLAVKLNLIELADAIDQQSNIVTEFLLYVGNGRRCVFDNVVQNCGFNCLRIEAHVGEFLGDGNGVGYIGFASLACLALVGLGAELIGANDRLNLLTGEIAFERFNKVPQTVVAF